MRSHVSSEHCARSGTMRPLQIATMLGVIATAGVLAAAMTGFGSDEARGTQRGRELAAGEMHEYEQGETEEENEGPPDEWLLTRRLYNSRLSVAQLARATADAQRLREQAPMRAPGAQAAWSFLGPETVGGRLLDI